MHFELPDTIVEIADTSHKDNYNKVVIQKRKCVPCTAETVITLSEDVVSDASVSTGTKLKYILNNNNNMIRPSVPPKPSQFLKRDQNVSSGVPGPHVVSTPNV